ncbi:MAG: glycosyltransferase [Bacteroidaceae bacterium]|nr:glycosyltransferase [Bacteroidaceae bacterium]
MTPKLSILVPCFNQEVLAIKALDSIPRRDDVEVIASDDGSSDKTLCNLVMYKEAHPELNLIIRANGRNGGCFYNGNRLLDLAQGEYIHTLDNDDYLYTEEYSRAIDQIDGEDCVYISLRINNGFVLDVSPDSRMSLCAPTTKFVRRAFAEGIRYPEDRKNDGDWFYNVELVNRNPVCKYTHIVAYHYNHPREGSIYDLLNKGKL